MHTLQKVRVIINKIWGAPDKVPNSVDIWQMLAVIASLYVPTLSSNATFFGEALPTLQRRISWVLFSNSTVHLPLS